MTDKRGTGEVLGEVEIGEVGTLVFEDDGCQDSDTWIYLDENNDGTRQIGRIRIGARHAEDKGDGWFIEQLERAGDSGQSPPSVSSSSFDRAPPTYSCDSCHNTWPRGTNQTPDADEDTCPDCAGE